MFSFLNNNIINRVPGVAILTSKFPTLSPITKRILSVYFKAVGKILLFSSLGVIPYFIIKNPLTTQTMKAVGWIGITVLTLLVIRCTAVEALLMSKLLQQRKNIQTINFIVKKLQESQKDSCYHSNLKTAAEKYEVKNYDDYTSLKAISEELLKIHGILNKDNLQFELVFDTYVNSKKLLLKMGQQQSIKDHIQLNGMLLQKIPQLLTV